jgi:hypothetical protein
MTLLRDGVAAKIFRSARHSRAGSPYGSAMAPIDPNGARELLEAIIAAFSVLGGGMACFSGFRAAQALAEKQPPDVVAHSINEGIAEAFETFSPLSMLALIIMGWH